jgi:hypothetical protein
MCLKADTHHILAGAQNQQLLASSVMPIKMMGNNTTSRSMSMEGNMEEVNILFTCLVSACTNKK